jgi:putative SOS response-associated peptidase YedK
VCYNITLNKKIEYLEKRFRATFESPHLFEPIYHVSAFSTPLVPVISNRKPNTIQLYQWGLIPYWAKDQETADKIRYKTFNARAETLLERASFKVPIKRKRCLVLADGFFEWREYNKNKYPYFIHLSTNEAFGLAGIWDSWIQKETGKSIHTFSIITTRANQLLEKIHNVKKRMPVILKKEDEVKWLDQSLSLEEVNSFLHPYEGNDLEAHTVSKLISARGVDTNVPKVIVHYEYKELAELN